MGVIGLPDICLATTEPLRVTSTQPSAGSSPADTTSTARPDITTAGIPESTQAAGTTLGANEAGPCSPQGQKCSNHRTRELFHMARKAKGLSVARHVGTIRGE